MTTFFFTFMIRMHIYLFNGDSFENMIKTAEFAVESLVLRNALDQLETHGCFIK